jgi:hypothetical protein
MIYELDYKQNVEKIIMDMDQEKLFRFVDKYDYNPYDYLRSNDEIKIKKLYYDLSEYLND